MELRRRCVAGAVLLGVVLGAIGCQKGTASEDAWSRVVATKWRLERIDQKPLIAGSEITLAFDEERLFGNAGANNYFAGFERKGTDGLSVTPVASTQMYLDQPPGLMDQEGRYLGLLQSADAFRLNGDRLQLLKAGRSVLDFVSRSP